MKTRKAVILAVALILIMSVLAGCSGTDKAASGDKKNVTLKWMMLGPGKQQDSAMVWDEYNKKLQGFLPGVNVQFEVIPGADYLEKYKLLTASREPIDIMWVGWMINYVDEARNGSYAALDDLMKKNAQSLKKEIPDWVWEFAKVDDKIYSVPNYQMYTQGNYGLVTPKEYADKYIDKEKMQRVFLENKTFTAESYDAIGEYLAKLKQEDKLQMGISTFFPIYNKGYEQIVNQYVIKSDDLEFKVQNKWQIPEAKLYFARVADWFKKGYIRSDIISVQNPRQDEGKQNGYSLWMRPIMKNEAERYGASIGFPVETIPMVEEFFIPSDSNSTATVIPSISKNKEAAIKVLELMNTEKGIELYNLLVYGIEDVHYTKQTENRIEQKVTMPGNPVNNDKYGLTKWAIGNTYYAYETQADLSGWNEYIKEEVNGRARRSKLIGFKPDLTLVKTEIAQVSAVTKEYLNPLMSGALPDYEAKYAEFMDKLEKSGNSKIIEELQRQIDNFVSKNNIK